MLQSRCQRKVNGTVSVWVWRVTENSILMNGIFEDTWSEELNKLFLVKIQFTEDYTWLSRTWRAKILERRNSDFALTESQRELESQRQQSLKPNHTKLDVREYICVANWRWRIVFIKNAVQEVAEKLNNNFKGRFYQEKYTEKTAKIERISYAAWSGITNSESIFLRSWLAEHVWQYLRSSSSSYYLELKKPSREVGMPRNTRENMNIPGKLWLSTCSTRSWWITQWLKKFGDISGDSEKRRNWEQW